jgi:hypothetical protein
LQLLELSRSHLLQFLRHALMEFGIDGPSHPIQCLSLSYFELPLNDLLQLRDVSMIQDGYEVQLYIQWSAIVRKKDRTGLTAS